MDNRPAAVAQRKLAESVLQQRALRDAIHNSPRIVAQRHKMNALFGGAVRPQGDGAMSAELSPAQREEKPNNTGLPNQLKSGIESLSGMSMDHVKVHYNSDKPAQLQAHAYAQGNEIHLGAGQERHLPHEAWHVVQQAQGRVRPTLQMKAGAVNDDPSLEKEADMMAEKAAQFEGDHVARPLVAEERVAGVVTQHVAGSLFAGAVQRQKDEAPHDRPPPGQAMEEAPLQSKSSFKGPVQLSGMPVNLNALLDSSSDDQTQEPQSAGMRRNASYADLQGLLRSPQGDETQEPQGAGMRRNASYADLQGLLRSPQSDGTQNPQGAAMTRSIRHTNLAGTYGGSDDEASARILETQRFSSAGVSKTLKIGALRKFIEENNRYMVLETLLENIGGNSKGHQHITSDPALVEIFYAVCDALDISPEWTGINGLPPRKTTPG